MKLKLWAAFGTLLAAALGAQAQQSTRTPDPADASVAVPPTGYVSAMTNHSPTVKGGVSPDKNWRAANAAVADPSADAGHASHGAHAGHAGHGAHAGHAGHGNHASQPGHDAAPVQRPPGNAPANASEDHHKHH